MNEQELKNAVVAAAEALVLALMSEGTILPAKGSALPTLVESVERLHAWQENSNEPERPGLRPATKSCERCEAVFFFARYGEVDLYDPSTTVAVSGRANYSALVKGERPRWVPLELDSVDSASVLAEWRWVVDFATRPPVAEIREDATGPVYVDHRQTCGAGEGPRRRCVPYDRRYKVNSAKINAETVNESIRTANNLVALQRRLRDSDMEDHDES